MQMNTNHSPSDKSFYDKSNLKKHQRLHTGEHPFSCCVCNKSYSDQSNLKKHVHVHSDVRPHSCDVCKKEFVFKGNMTQHHKHMHGEQRQLKCDVCNKSFTILPDLKKINCCTVKIVDIDVICAVCHSIS